MTLTDKWLEFWGQVRDERPVCDFFRLAAVEGKLPESVDAEDDRVIEAIGEIKAAIVTKPEGAKTREGWCDEECPHLELGGIDSCSCAHLGDLDWYDGPLAKCEGNFL
jgi:hypothetical protein